MLKWWKQPTTPLPEIKKWKSIEQLQIHKAKQVTLNKNTETYETDND